MTKTPSPAIKVITVSVFTVLIICFVCYRVGAFDNFSFNSTSSEYYSEADNSQMAVDTPIVAKDSVVVEREIMPSSKMMVMPKPKKVDTVKKTQTPNQSAAPKNNNSEPKKSDYMGSSKSGVIFEPPVQSVDTSKKPKQ